MSAAGNLPSPPPRWAVDDADAVEWGTQPLLDALPGRAALVDGEGLVRACNARWLLEPGPDVIAPGQDYIETTRRGDATARSLCAAMGRILGGGESLACVEYGIDHDPSLAGRCTISPMLGEGPRLGNGAPGALVLHQAWRQVPTRRGSRSEALERLLLVADAMPARISYYDSNLVYQYVNPAYAAWFGSHPEVLVGRTVPDVLGPHRYDEVADRIRKALDGERTTYVVHLPDQAGSWGWLHIDHVPHVDAQGRVRGVGTLIYDITASKALAADLAEARDEAQRANRAKTEFLVRIGAGLKPPLDALLGFSEVLMGEVFGPLGDPAYKQCGHDIHETVGRLLAVIQDVRDLSAAAAGHLELSEERIPLGPLLSGCLRRARDTATGRGTAIIMEDPGAAALFADERLLRLALNHLLDNAIRHTPADGTVRLLAESPGDGGLRLVVTDSGAGIEPETLDRLRHAFPSTGAGHDPAGVTGLGLPLARQIAEAHGGRLDIASRPGHGTQAALIFPRERVLRSP